MTWQNREQPGLFKMTWKLLSHNGGLKFLSILFSVLLFLILRTQQTRELQRTAKLKINTAENVVLIGSWERPVDVTVRLPNSIFAGVPSESALMGELDLTREKPGKVRVHISRENFPLLDARYGLVIHEQWLDIELDAKVRKKVPVRAVLQGSPADQLIIEKTIVTPDEVEVRGARRELSNLDFLSTMPINVDGISNNMSANAKLSVDEFSSMKTSSERVDVEIFVGAKLSRRIFENILVHANFPGKFKIMPTRIDVEVQGSEQAISKLRTSNIYAYVEPPQKQDEWNRERVLFRLPENVSLVRSAPETVSIKVEKQ